MFSYRADMISIIGAGPVGNYLAYLLAKNRKEVNVYEEHSKVGKPVQCTGIVTSVLKNLIPVKKEFLVNEINCYRIIAPNKDKVEFKLKEKDIIVDRAKFDDYIRKIAEKKGAKYFYNHKFLDLKENKKIRLKFNKREVTTNILVGADGPYSAVAKAAGLYKDRKFIAGVQARVKMKLDPDVVEAYLGYGTFAWLVPEDDKIGRLGVAHYSKANYYFKKLLKMKKGKIIEYQSGVIPVYNRKVRTQKNNIYLVGDAAGMIKDTTHGGIVMGMMAAKELSNAIVNKENYDKMWRRSIGKELFINSILRRMMDKFNDKDYDKLVELFKQEKTKELMESYSRDFPSKFVLSLILKEPRLLKYGFKLI